MTEEFKDALTLSHILLLTNICLFVLITFITWDMLWWWDIGNWAGMGRIIFLFILVIVNAFVCGGFYNWKKIRTKNK